MGKRRNKHKKYIKQDVNAEEQLRHQKILHILFMYPLILALGMLVVSGYAYQVGGMWGALMATVACMALTVFLLIKTLKIIAPFLWNN